jgi:hypothetical protein
MVVRVNEEETGREVVERYPDPVAMTASLPVAG